MYATAAELGLDPLLDELNMLELVSLVAGDAGETIDIKLGLVPEPSTTLLFTTALVGVGLATRKRRVR